MISGRVHIAHAGSRRVGSLQGFKNGIRRDVRVLALLGFHLTVLYALASPWLVFVVRVIFLMLHTKSLSLLHERPLLAFVQQPAENQTRRFLFSYISLLQIITLL